MSRQISEAARPRNAVLKINTDCAAVQICLRAGMKSGLGMSISLCRFDIGEAPEMREGGNAKQKRKGIEMDGDGMTPEEIIEARLRSIERRIEQLEIWSRRAGVEMIKHKETGWLAPVGDVGSLSEGILWLEEARRDPTLRLRCRAWALENWNPAQRAEEYSSLFATIAK